MTTRCDSCSLLEKCVFLLLITVYSVTADQECDPYKCPGPLRYYKNLGCKPVYKNEGDCCAIRYDCDHLKSRAKNKCYVNGYEYSIGEVLKDEHKNPCDIGCICQEGFEGVAWFQCAIVDCLDNFTLNPKCFYQNSPYQCCLGKKICVDDIKDRATCTTENGVYSEGDSFRVKSDPDLICVCQPGYTGENIEPFCKKPNRPSCGPEFSNPYMIHDKCAPVFYPTQLPQTDCSFESRCQSENDTIIHNHDEIKLKSGEVEDETMMCPYGDLKLHLGDELNQHPGYSSNCVKCTCEVPPILTCQHLTDEECAS